MLAFQWVALNNLAQVGLNAESITRLLLKLPNGVVHIVEGKASFIQANPRLCYRLHALFNTNNWEASHGL